MTPLRYHEAAAEELLHEIGYLEFQAQGLGRRFFAEIRRAEDRIAQFPQSAQEIRPGIRKCLLRVFQYALIYAIERDGILTLNVPEPLVKRLKQQAAAQHRSLNDQVILYLEQMTHSISVDADALLARVRALHRTPEGVKLTDRGLRALKMVDRP